MSFWLEVLLLLVSLLLGVVPLYLLRRYDLHDPEPFPILLGSALVGGFVAGALTFAAFFALDLAGLAVRPASIHSFLFIGPIEELAKLTGFYAASRLFAEYFDEPVDYAIYMGAVAIGFAALENAVYAAGVSGSDSAPALAESGWLLGLRLVVTTPVHVIWSIFVGLGIARFVKEGGGPTPILRGLLLAAVLHGLWDFAAFRAWPYVLLHLFFFWLFFRGRFILSYLLAASHLRPRLVDELAAAPVRDLAADGLAPCPACGDSSARSVRLLPPGEIFECGDCGRHLAAKRTLEDVFHYYGSLMRGLVFRWRRADSAPPHACAGRVDSLIEANFLCRDTGLAFFKPEELGGALERVNAKTVARYERLWLRV